MPDFAVTLLIVMLAGGLGFTIAHLLGRGAAAIESTPPTPPEEFRPLPHVTSDIRKVASDILPYYNASAYAADLLDEPMFRRGVELLCDKSVSVETLLGYYTGDSAILATMGLEALARRDGDPDVRPQILDGINERVGEGASLDDVMNFLFDATHAIYPCDRIGLAFVEDEERVVAHWLRALYEPILLDKGYAEDLEESSLAAVLKTGRLRIINDLEEYGRRKPSSRAMAELLTPSTLRPATRSKRRMECWRRW